LSLHTDLLRQAIYLAAKEPRRPLQASLRRSISTAYYALFHLLIYEATKRLISGSDRVNLRYSLSRAFSHSSMKVVAQNFANNRVSQKISAGLNGLELQPQLMNVAASFVDLQQARHEADYDVSRRFTKQETIDLVELSKQAFEDWQMIRNTYQSDTFLIGLLAQQNMRV